MSQLGLFIAVLCAGAVCAVWGAQPATETENGFNKRDTDPATIDRETYAKICLSCGHLYGQHFTYRCLSDETHETFKNCIVVLSRRR